MIVVNQLNTSTPYYLKKLPQNLVNNNKYVYYSGIEGDIDIINECWYFKYSIFLNNNFELPSNCLNANLVAPFVNVSNLTLTKISSPTFPDYVIDKSTCSEYLLQFSIDTSSSKFFDTLFIDYILNFSLYFDIDSEILNSAKLGNNPLEIDEFINEFNSLVSNTKISYTNYHLDDNEGCVDIINSYHVSNNSYSANNKKIIYYAFNNNTINLTSQINELCTIEIDGNFYIKQYKIEMNYSVNNKTIKTLTTNLNEMIICKDKYQLSYPFETTYDYTKDEVINIIGDNCGFFIPFDAIGYYTITLLIFTNNTFITIKLTKSFNFVEKNIGNYIICSQYWIDNLDYFKRYKI